MTKAYRYIQHWNHWLTHSLGNSISLIEKKELHLHIKPLQKETVVLLGVPEQNILFTPDPLSNQFIVSPLINRNKTLRFVESDFFELSIQSGSIDVVILAHTLELVDNPQKLLSEACRIVKPEGHIIVMGFNPHSMWGFRKLLAHHKKIPWSLNFVQAATVKKWLALSDFDIEQQQTFLFRPPFQNPKTFEKFNFLESMGKKCYNGFGGIYLIRARAKVIPITPIRMHWSQQLAGLQGVIKTISGASIRNRGI